MLTRTVLIWALMLSAPLVAWPQFQPRSVDGVVTDKRGNTLPGAVVQLENSETLTVISYIADGEGRYHFGGLHDDVDYVLKARYRSHWSKPKTLSKFNSAKQADVDLVVITE